MRHFVYLFLMITSLATACPPDAEQPDDLKELYDERGEFWDRDFITTPADNPPDYDEQDMEDEAYYDMVEEEVGGWQ